MVAFLSLNIYTQEEHNAGGRVFSLFTMGVAGPFYLYRIISFRSFRIFVVVLDALRYVLV